MHWLASDLLAKFTLVWLQRCVGMAVNWSSWSPEDTAAVRSYLPPTQGYVKLGDLYSKALAHDPLSLCHKLVHIAIA